LQEFESQPKRACTQVPSESGSQVAEPTQAETERALPEISAGENWQNCNLDGQSTYTSTSCVGKFTSKVPS
jgi:hypothetical protein